MASSQGRAPERVSWQHMRNKSIWSAGQVSDAKARSVKSYFNTFIENHPGYTFQLGQMFDELFQLCITTDQCKSIKRELERRLQIPLEEFKGAELLEGAVPTNKTFSRASDLRQFQDHVLPTLNKPIIQRKLQQASRHFIRVKNAFKEQEEKELLAFDIEVYEHDFSKMLEIGYVVLHFSTPRYGQSTLPQIQVKKRRHLIIEENLHYKNADRVPDNRDGFRFGVSHTTSLRDAVKEFRKDVRESDYILGQSVEHDDDYLRNIGVDLAVLGKEMFDTQVIQAYKESLKKRDNYAMRGLWYMLKEYKLNYDESHLHNAGCDAFYTMMVFLRQMDYSATEVNTLIAKCQT